MKFKIKYADQIVGSLSLIAIAALIFIIFFIGSKQKWFVPKHPFYTVVSSGSNVSEGMAIQYKGFGIGKVTKITLNDNDQVIVNFYISDEYINRIKHNSVIELSVSPIGLGSSLIFYPGLSDGIIEDDSFIPEKSSPEAKVIIKNHLVQLSEQTDSITTIVNSATSLVKDIDYLVVQISDILDGNLEDSPLAQTFTQINTILSQISLFLSGDDSVALSNITNNLTTSIQKLNLILDDVNTLTGAIKNPQGLIPRLLETEESNGAISQLFDSLDQTLGDVNGISSSIGSEMPQISVILAQVQTLLKQIQDIAIGVKNNPLIKGNSSEKPESASVTPKLREEAF
ncbi:MAG: MlaD family protein [Treponema sp.]|nr:MlaD family protein [Treponema sp.]